MVVDAQVVVAVITGLFGLIGGIVGAVSLYKQVSKKADTDLNISNAAHKMDAMKTEAISKAEAIKAQSESEARRIDSMIDLAMKRIEGLEDENKSQRTEMTTIRISNDETRNKLDVCLSEKAKNEIEANRRIAALESKITKLEEGDEMARKYLLMEDKIMHKQKNGKVKIENATIEGEKK